MLKDYTPRQQGNAAGLMALREQCENRRGPQQVVFPAPPAPDISEAGFQALIVGLLRICGWWVQHETDSRKSEHGFPDLWAVRPPRLMAIELKTTKGAPDLPQLWWAADLHGCQSDTFQYHLWTPRPEDWPAILLAVAPPNTTFDPHATVAYLTRLGQPPERKPAGRRKK